MVHWLRWNKSCLIEIFDYGIRGLDFTLGHWFLDQFISLCGFFRWKTLFQSLGEISLLIRLSVCHDIIIVRCTNCVENNFFSSILVCLLLYLSLFLFLHFCDWLVFLHIFNNNSIDRSCSHICVDCIFLSLEHIGLKFWLEVCSLLWVKSISWHFIHIYYSFCLKQIQMIVSFGLFSIDLVFIIIWLNASLETRTSRHHCASF